VDVTRYRFVPVKIEREYEDDQVLVDITVMGTHSFVLEQGWVTHNTAIQARDRVFQAILPLRGKVLNVGKTTLNKALTNREIATIIAALGVGVSKNDVDLSGLRYHKVILMCHVGDTRIPLLDGRTMTMRELADGKAGNQFWVYGADPKTGRPVPALAYLPTRTGEARELIELVFDDGTSCRCTPHHKWVKTDGTNILAQNIIPGESLMSVYRRMDKKGYEKIYDPTMTRSNKWVNTHTMVAGLIWDEDRERCAAFCSSRVDQNRNRHPVVHHVNYDKRNNVPENLYWMPSWEHMEVHSFLGTEQIVRYNRSEKHRQRIKDLHADGHYAQYTWANTYNGSARHLDAIARTWADDGMRKKILSGFDSYRGSQKNKDTATKRNKKMWQDPEYRKKHLERLTNPSSEVRDKLSKHASGQWKDPEMRDKIIKGRVLGVLHRLVVAGVSSDELRERYNLEKPKNTPRYDVAIKRWGESILVDARYYNHQVVSVNRIVLESPEPVYNMTVLGHHNYMLENGVISKNSDADADGGHICCLLLTLFHKYMRKIIEEGYLYVCDLPLYRVRIGTQSQYIKDDDALQEFLGNNAGKKVDISRFKGLGEMDSDELEETAMNGTTRRLKRVFIDDSVAAAEMFDHLMGDDVTHRKQFLYDELDFQDE